MRNVKATENANLERLQQIIDVWISGLEEEIDALSTMEPHSKAWEAMAMLVFGSENWLRAARTFGDELGISFNTRYDERRTKELNDFVKEQHILWLNNH